eukprot:scaffold54_cov536-Pavlova_lutheri.AAC.1
MEEHIMARYKIDKGVGPRGPIHERAPSNPSPSWVETWSGQNPCSKGTRPLLRDLPIEDSNGTDRD